MLAELSARSASGTPKRTAVAVCAMALAALWPARGSAAEPTLITDAAQLWGLSTELKAAPVPIRLEGRVSYYDPFFRLFWLETRETGTYILLGTDPPRMRTGQRVRLEGTLISDRGLEASRVQVTVLEEQAVIVPLPTRGRIGDLNAFGGRIVNVSAYVDGQQYVDDEHVRLALIVDERPVIGWVKPANPPSVPDWSGKFVDLEALYSARFDPTNTATTIELWTEESRVKVTGTLATAAAFRRARTPIGEISRLPSGSEVMVSGRVEAHDPGTGITIRDESGQVVVHSIQQERLPLGANVEATGAVAIAGARWVLRNGLYRRMLFPPDDGGGAASKGELLRVGEIRELSLAEAQRGRPVRLLGMVTWSMPGPDFFFLQDVSGGIRVRFDPRVTATPSLGKYLEIEGTTAAGGFVPEVVFRRLTDRGSMSPPEPRPVTFEQAITGNEDGQWVEMRGFLQRTESDGDWRWIYVTTPGGDFVGHLQSPVNFVANPGSLIRVQGVCETTTNRAGQITGVMLRVPFIHSIRTEEDAPTDYYDLPEHSIKGLRQLRAVRELTRVRVTGTVLHAIPGRAVYLQEGDTGLQVLTRQAGSLAPGDRVEAVGILGWEGVRLVLRESVYRRLGGGLAPAPVSLADVGRLEPALDTRLVKVRGLLLDVARQGDHARLTLQSGRTIFDATVGLQPGDAVVELPPGAGLELSGLYRLAFDDVRQTRGFTLQVRSPADVRVYQPPRLWTVQRALIACAVLGGAVLLGVAWIAALRRRVRQQTEQLREQLDRQVRLEAEVQRAARLESLGALAGGIAHDFNNLLTIIIGNLGLAMLDARLSPATSRCLQEIERGTTRARALTRQLLTFAKGGEPLRAPVELAEVVKTAAERALHGGRSRCTYEFAPGLWLANADKDQIAQVVHNLVTNAADAMPAGGEVRVTLRNDELAADPTRSLAGGRYVRLSVSDAGEGISPEVLPKIFDPYFSTKRVGSGLGLATVYSIVKRHDGWVEVDSKPGQGATFAVWLPAAEGPAPVPQPPPEVHFPVVPPARKSGRVLLMEDEPSIQQIVAEVLARMGIAVTIVADGGAALREFTLARHNQTPFDLLILDLTIPGGMGGREVIELVRKLDPLVPAIVSSGYSSDPVMANFGQFGFQAMVQKPYEIGELVAVIERLLARRPAGK